MTAPRPVGQPSKFDKSVEGQAFIDYVTNTPSCLTVPMFATTRGYSSDTMLTWCKEDPSFRRSYMQAKEIIGINRLKMTLSDSRVKLDKTIYLKGVANYDMDAKDHEKEMIAYEASLKTEKPEDCEKTKLAAEVLKGFTEELKNQRSTLKSEDININEATKS
jgi:hypothetical protein